MKGTPALAIFNRARRRRRRVDRNVVFSRVKVKGVFFTNESGSPKRMFIPFSSLPLVRVHRSMLATLTFIFSTFSRVILVVNLAFSLLLSAHVCHFLPTSSGFAVYNEYIYPTRWLLQFFSSVRHRRVTPVACKRTSVSMFSTMFLPIFALFVYLEGPPRIYPNSFIYTEEKEPG